LNIAIGQDQKRYAELIKEAWSLYESKEYRHSGLKYAEAFVAFGGKGMITDRYNAAFSRALANEPDSSFVQLFKIAEYGNYTNLVHITMDEDLIALHNDDRWERVIEIVRSNNEKDSVNLIKVKKILDERGWLGPDVIGNQGNQTWFLVIQHAGIEAQEAYLPMMREAVKNGNARASSFALLEDRVALKKGGKQIYGSQIGRDQETGEYYILPLIDPDNVDSRRAEV